MRRAFEDLGKTEAARGLIVGGEEQEGEEELHLEFKNEETMMVGAV